ncbi:MAG: alpha/beta fold hydrolase [Mucilaginibacter sp.]
MTSDPKERYQFLALPDGRKLTYVEFGENNGHPVFYFHGTPASCYEALIAGKEILARFNLRIIAPNRPGVGGSDFQKHRSFSDWPKDVLALADHLGIQKFSIIGNSGGGGYALACAAKIPERLSSVAIVSGAWRMNSPIAKRTLMKPFSIFWKVADKFPFLMPFVLLCMRLSIKKPGRKALKLTAEFMPDADSEALQQKDRAEMLALALKEGLSSIKGAAWDIKLYVYHMDVDLNEIRFPVTFFHGEKDKNVPFMLANSMIHRVKNSTLIAYPNEGHLSTFSNHFPEIAQALLK